MTKNIFILAITSLVLAGCAATKSDLPHGGYHEFAYDWVVLDRCSSNGQIGADVTAFGQRRMVSNLNSYVYDTQELQTTINTLSKYMAETKSEDCNKIAVKIERARQASTAQASAPRVPLTTNCSTYFGQTFCQTY